MRNTLKQLDKQRMSFVAMVERHGKKTAFRGPDINTILIKDIKRIDTGELVADHIWFVAGKSWDGIKNGDKISFDARVTMYEKGYKGYRDDIYDKPVVKDYRLERPTKILVLEDI